MKYVGLMSKVKCMCCIVLNLMCLSLGDFIRTLGENSIRGLYLHIALVWLGVVLGGSSYRLYFVIFYVLMNGYALIDGGSINVHLGDLKVHFGMNGGVGHYSCIALNIT